MSEVKVNDELQEDLETEIEVEEDVADSQEGKAGEDQGDAAEIDLETELAQAKEEIADLRDNMLRAAAENENFKKRVERERLGTLKYAGESIFKEILAVVDNLERAIGQGVVEGVDAEKNLAALLEGVQLTLKSLTSTLSKFEVKPIESVGEQFDPKHHEAMTMDASESVPENHVITEFEKGYYYKDRLLRAAKVVVSSGENS